MSQLTSILFAPYNFFFGENGLFPSSPSTRNRTRDNQALYFGVPAIVFAVLGLLFLIVGELSAGKSLIHRYEENVEEIRKEMSELHSNLDKELKLKRAQGAIDPSDTDIVVLRDQLSETLESEEILLSKLYSLAPDEPKHLYDLAITFLNKSNLTMISNIEDKEAVAKSQRDQCFSIMKRIAPLDKPGFLDAHLFLAKSAIATKVKSITDAIQNLRLANIHLDHALLRDQENTTALRLKVVVAQRTGKTEDAQKYLRQLFAKDPFFYPQLCQVNSQLGLADDNSKVLHSAQERLSGQITQMTGFSDRRVRHVTYLIDCLHRLDKLDEADRRVKSEMAEFSDNDGIQRWGKRLLAVSQEIRYRSGGKLTQGNMNELLGYLREGHRLDPNNQRILKHIVALGRFKIPGLDKISKEIYQPGPKAPASVENILGTIAMSNGDYLEATKRFFKANEKSPNNGEYLNNLSYVYLTRPDPDLDEALKKVDQAIRSVRSGTIGGRYQTNFYDTKGKALLELGKIAEKEGNQQLADSHYAGAAASLLAALSKVIEPAPGDEVGKRVTKERRLKISQKIVECYEASGQPLQVKVWSDRVQQLSEEDKKTQ